MLNFGHKLLLVLLILGNLSFNPPVLALLTRPPITPTPSTTPSPSPTLSETPKIEQPKTQTELLEAQLEHMREFDGRILDTVWWALGGVVTIAFFVIGGSFLNYKWEKDKLERDREALTQQINDSKNTSKTEIEQLRKDLESSIINRLKQAEDSLQKQLIKENTKILYLYKKMEAELWEVKEVYNNVLLTHMEMIELAKRPDDEIPISEALEAMIKALNNIAERGNTDKLDKQVLSDIEKLIDSLDKEYEPYKTSIKELLRSGSPS